MNDLLKEAIADAKAVREIALANAKLALEEAMTPRLQSMLSQKLAEEAEGDEEEKSVEEDYGNDWFEEEPGSVSETEEEESDESAIEKVHEEDNEDGESVDTAEDDIDIDELFGEADEEEAPAEEMDEAEEEEIDEDLMEIIRQLEEDIDSSGIGTGDNKKPSPVASDDSTEDKKEKLVQLVNEEDEEDEDIKEMMRSIREEDEEEPKKDKVEEAEDEDEDTVDIKEILRALREEEDGEEKVDEAEEEKEKEMAEAKLREAYAVITFLRSKINEVNLLNSKLLFSNKLFKRHSLTEKQKITVIENFDRASSLREVKLVYATLSEALKSAKVNTKQLKESFASKPIASTRPKTIINEGDDMANRLRKLAGLK